MFDFRIKEPGVYNIPNRFYHSQCCVLPSISSTGLRLLRKKSPKHYWDSSDLNPNRKPKPETTKPLDFGAAAHSLTLQGELPESEYAVEDFQGPYNRNEPGWKAKEKRQWEAEQKKAGLIVVSQKNIETIIEMSKELGTHELIRDGLFRGEVEQSLFWQDPDFPGIMLKARPDVTPHDLLLPDYKSAASNDALAVNRSIWKYDYHMQMAMAIDGIRHTKGHEIEHASLVVQEKTRPYDVSVVPLSDHCISVGRVEYRHALKIFSQCLERNEWPGRGDYEAMVPSWKQEELELEGLV